MFRKTEYKTLVYWIIERENIRYLKEQGFSKPWTDDPILREYRFCNVNRNDDIVTVFIQNEVVRYDDPDIWFWLTICRFINRIDSLRTLELPWPEWDKQRFLYICAKITENNPPLYTAAYMLRGGKPNHKKYEYHAYDVFSPLWNKRCLVPNTRMCSDWYTFLAYPGSGIGRFLGNQIVTDLKYTNLLPKDTTLDWDTFCVPGPGTTMGLNILRGRNLRSSAAKETPIELLALREKLIKQLPHLEETFSDLNNVANCLCEFSKYWRCQHNLGRPKVKYQGI